MLLAKLFNASVRRRRLASVSRRARQRLAIESLEHRLAMAITVPISDLTGLAPADYDVWVTGHGIPGWQPAGQPPLYLMSLDSSGSFSQTAVAVTSASSTGTTATITTASPHGLMNNDSVFLAGVGNGYNGSWVVSGITAGTPNSFNITTTLSNLPSSSTGTVYEDSLVSTQALVSATSVNFGNGNGLAQFVTSAPHGLSVDQTIEITGVSVNGYNGVFSVGQVVDATSFEVTYQAVSALGPGTGGTLKSVALQPVKLSDLPGSEITLDTELTNISSKLLVYVSNKSSAPGGLPFGGNGVTPTDPATPPYNPGAQAPTSVFDIVEFAYLPWGATSSGTTATITTTSPHGLALNDSVTISGVNDASGAAIPGYNITANVTAVLSPQSFTYTTIQQNLAVGGSGSVSGGNNASISSGFSTFDVSAVDGLAIPMNLLASNVKSNAINSVGVRVADGYTRQAIGAAYQQFMSNDPLGHVDPGNSASRDFAKLLYQGQVLGTAIAGIAASWSNNTVTFTYTGNSILQDEWVVISGFTGPNAGYNGTYQVQSAASGSFTVTNTDSSLTNASGGTVTPLLFEASPSVDNQFFSITAPKDWLNNQQPTATAQPPGLASQDPLATFWDTTIDNFFQSGNYLSIYLGKEPSPNAIYSGSSDGTKYTLSNGLNSYQFQKPTGGSLANAAYVWSQANAPGGDAGLLQDQIWQALCRGVALDGVSTTPITSNESTTAWANYANWYTQHASAAFPSFQSVYCPYSKFLHYSTLAGTVDTTGATSIYLDTAAYGFGEDENPIVSGGWTGPQVPSKLDGTILDGTTSASSSVTVTLIQWDATESTLAAVSGDFNGDTLTDIAEFVSTGQWKVAITPTNPADTPSTVAAGTPWVTSGITWSDFTVIHDSATSRDVIIARASNSVDGSWWKLSYDGSSWSTNFVGSWGIPDSWVDIVVGDFDGNANQDIAGRHQTSGEWWMLSNAAADATDMTYAAKNVRIGAWNPTVTWENVVAGAFDSNAPNAVDLIAGRVGTNWWLLTPGELTPATTPIVTGFATDTPWVDAVVGNFTGSVNGEQIAVRHSGSGQWHTIAYNGSTYAASFMVHWGTHVTWSNVGTADADGNGIAEIAGQNGDSFHWWSINYSSSTFGTTDLDVGQSTKPSGVYAFAFPGTYLLTATPPATTFGILGRLSNKSWQKAMLSVQSGTPSLTVVAAPGYPA